MTIRGLEYNRSISMVASSSSMHNRFISVLGKVKVKVVSNLISRFSSISIEFIPCEECPRVIANLFVASPCCISKGLFEFSGPDDLNSELCFRVQRTLALYLSL